MFQQLRRFLFSPTAIWLYSAINAAVFLAIAFWIFTDARFGEVAIRLRGQLSSPSQLVSEPINDVQLAENVLRLKLLMIVGLISGMLIVAGAIFGPPRHRRVHSWLGLTFIAALWLTLLSTWSDFMWSGQIFRSKRETGNFQALATSLHDVWPDGDGSLSNIGPFNAYPAGQPRMLQLLTERRSPRGGVSFSQIERSENGALGFKLTGRDAGAWLEWHPAHDLPKSFVGGLAQRYDLNRFAPLGKDWFLVRYK